jgi:hypothetical protein
MPIIPIGETIFTTGALNTIVWTSNLTTAGLYGITTLNLILGTGAENRVTELGMIVEGLKFPETEQYEWGLDWRKYDVSQNCEYIPFYLPHHTQCCINLFLWMLEAFFFRCIVCLGEQMVYSCAGLLDGGMAYCCGTMDVMKIVATECRIKRQTSKLEH